MNFQNSFLCHTKTIHLAQCFESKTTLIIKPSFVSSNHFFFILILQFNNNKFIEKWNDVFKNIFWIEKKNDDYFQVYFWENYFQQTNYKNKQTLFSLATLCKSTLHIWSYWLHPMWLSRLLRVGASSLLSIHCRLNKSKETKEPSTPFANSIKLISSNACAPSLPIATKLHLSIQIFSNEREEAIFMLERAS